MTKSLYDPAVELKGRIEGRMEGRVEGRIEGENRKALEVAKEMLADGEPVEKIIKYSKLALVEIEKLRSEMLKH